MDAGRDLSFARQQHGIFGSIPLQIIGSMIGVVEIDSGLAVAAAFLRGELHGLAAQARAHVDDVPILDAEQLGDESR